MVAVASGVMKNWDDHLLLRASASPDARREMAVNSARTDLSSGRRRSTSEKCLVAAEKSEREAKNLPSWKCASTSLGFERIACCHTTAWCSRRYCSATAPVRENPPDRLASARVWTTSKT